MTETDAKQPSRRPKRPLRDAALDVTRTLQNAGYTTYWAGGCVRDMLAGNPPKDYDVATSAKPEEVCALFQKTRKVGAQFGVILVRRFGHDLEIATFRTDHDYADGRRPTGVTFSSPEEDAQRRDFSINGMFYDPIAGVVHDFVGGQADLTSGVIRAIGDPAARFAEDHLRILRAVRFASRFGFKIEPKTWEAMKAAAAQLQRISPERVRMELESMLHRPGRAKAIQSLADCGALEYLWSNSAQLRENWPLPVRVLEKLPATSSFELGLAAVLIGQSKDAAAKACDALRCSNYSADRVAWLLTNKHAFDEPAGVSLADLKLLMAQEGFEELCDLATALHDVNGLGNDRLKEIRERAAAIPKDQVAPPPLVTGDDLIAMGFKPGPAFKDVLQEVYRAQLDGDVSTKDEAMNKAEASL